MTLPKLPVPASGHTLSGGVSERDSLAQSIRREVAAILAVAMGLLLVALNLPLAAWLEFVLQHRGYALDELIFVFIVLSFIFPVFSIRRWHELSQAFKARAHVIAQLEQRAQMEAQLSQLTTLLHSCLTPGEASKIVTHYATTLFPSSSGALYAFRSSRNLLELAAEWGTGHTQEGFLSPEQCWALRQGQLYEVQDPALTVSCFHVKESRPYLCLPMMAHGEVLALLHVHTSVSDDAAKDAEQRALVLTFAERVSLAFSNLRLRDALRQQSVRDPLTGLFNRRYLDEALAIEVPRATRAREPFSVIMLDLDHFKRFNDTHGHDAGDAVLQAIGGFLKRDVRGGDIACRYGGEEFCLVLPGTSLEVAQERGRQLCQGVRSLPLDFRGQALGTLTLSMGIATFPDHGETAETVLHVADAALYKAKAEGRDRFVVAA